jgi:hypothetical protein
VGESPSATILAVSLVFANDKSKLPSHYDTSS